MSFLKFVPPLNVNETISGGTNMKQSYSALVLSENISGVALVGGVIKNVLSNLFFQFFSIFRELNLLK